MSFTAVHDPPARFRIVVGLSAGRRTVLPTRGEERTARPAHSGAEREWVGAGEACVGADASATDLANLLVAFHLHGEKRGRREKRKRMRGLGVGQETTRRRAARNRSSESLL